MRTYEVTLEIKEYRKVTVQSEERLNMADAVAAAVIQEDLLAMNTRGVFLQDLTPKPRPVKDRIRDAFKAMRKDGIVARMNYQCCSSCGWAALESDYPNFNDETDTAVFYHSQDAEAFDGKDLRTYKYWGAGNELVSEQAKLYLAHHGDAHAIVAHLKAQGLTIEWDGDTSRRIAVTGTEEGTL